MKKFLLISCIILAFTAYVYFKSFMGSVEQEDPGVVFKPFIDSCMEAKYEGNFIKEPYIMGKVLTINLNDSTLDDLTFTKIPELIKAKNPDEVGTLIIIEWYTIKEGEYLNEETNEKIGDAFRSCGSVAIIDLEKKEMIQEKIFQGTDPLKIKSLEGDFTSMKPLFEIIEYLDNLPIK